MEILEYIPLASYTTFSIGGKSRYFAIASSKDEMKKALLFAKIKKIPFFILGKGSNCLFDDCGFAGLVILNKIDDCKIEGEIVQVGAGVSFSYLGLKTSKLNLSGLEFATGIPATVGGAIYMNAGANGKSTWDTLQQVTFFDEDLVEKTALKNQFRSDYRFSSFQKNNFVILSAIFSLKREKDAKNLQKELITYRVETQPYGEKSAGCIFKNPIGQSAGSLIDQCGLKGLSVGSVKVSEKHANFIVAKEGASSKDIKTLISLVQKKVKKDTGVNLESEIRMVPYEG